MTHISRLQKQIAAVAECSLKLYKKASKQVIDMLVDRIRRCEDSKRLIAVYVIDAVIMRSHKKLGADSYPQMLQSKLGSVFELVSYCSTKDKTQIGKVLAKFRDRDVYEAKVVEAWAKAARCTLPKPGELQLKRTDSITSTR